MTAPESNMLKIVPEACLAPIGRVISQWAWCDALLEQAIWKLLGVSWRKGRAVSAHLGSRAKIDLIKTLMHFTRRDKAPLKHLEDEGKILIDQRNLVAHGCVVGFPGGSGLVTFNLFSARGKLTEKHRTAVPEVIEDLAARIARYNLFLGEFHELLPPSRGTRREPGTSDPKNSGRRRKANPRKLPPPLGWSQAELNELAQRQLAQQRREMKQKKAKNK